MRKAFAATDLLPVFRATFIQKQRMATRNPILFGTAGFPHALARVWGTHVCLIVISL